MLLANGETAVSVQRGARANTPWVICIIDKDGIPVSRNQCVSTANASHSIEAAVSFDKVHVAVNIDKVRKARAGIPR